jgi:hypothetical protein
MLCDVLRLTSLYCDSLRFTPIMTEKFFKTKEIEYPEQDPVDELMELYKEEKDILDNDDDTFKNVISKQRKKHHKKVLIIFLFILVFLAGSAMAGFLFFSKYQTANTENVNITIEAPEEILIGETFDYIINYENIGNVGLKNNIVKVQYPHGFIVESTDPATSNHSFPLADIRQYQKGKIKITGKIIDSLDNEQKLIAKIDYEPSNFNAKFSKETSFSTIIKKPELDMEINHLANASLGQKIDFEININNKGQIDFDDTKINFIAPEGFEITTTTPSPYEDSTWLIPEINSEKLSHEIKISGNFKTDLVFTNEEQRTQKFNVKFMFLGNEEEYFAVMEEEFEIKIVDQAIASYLIINGSADNKNVSLGDSLTISSIVKNNGTQDYEDVSIQTVIKSSPVDIFDWENITDDKLGKISNTDYGKAIVWTEKQIDNLATFSQKEEQTITVQLPIKKLAELGGDINSIADTRITVYTELIFDSEKNPGISGIKSSPIEIRLNSDLSFGTKALYYYEDGTPIGEGPLPMKADQETRLVVFWDLSNQLHELENISVTTMLPEYVSFSNNENVSAGDISYDSSERKIKWQINRLPKSVNEAHASFAITIKPTMSHVGQIIKLTGITTISAKDKETEDLIIKTKNIITSALENDDNAIGDGLIIK